MRLRGLPILILLLMLSACSSTEPVAESSQQTDLEELFWQRQEDARSRFVQADVDFMVGMIAHHAQALIMSDLAEPNGASSPVQVLAARIINAQKDEIATMQRWLRQRGQAVPEVHIDGLTLMIHMPEGADGMDHGAHDHMMPGMLTQAQLEELAAAEGLEFDRLFLTYMIQHHKGATAMVDVLFATDGAGQDEGAFRLATDINVDQLTEIARMEMMLEGVISSTEE